MPWDDSERPPTAGGEVSRQNSQEGGNIFRRFRRLWFTLTKSFLLHKIVHKPECSFLKQRNPPNWTMWPTNCFPVLHKFPFSSLSSNPPLKVSLWPLLTLQAELSWEPGKSCSRWRPALTPRLWAEMSEMERGNEVSSMLLLMHYLRVMPVLCLFPWDCRRNECVRRQRGETTVTITQLDKTIMEGASWEASRGWKNNPTNHTKVPKSQMPCFWVS